MKEEQQRRFSGTIEGSARGRMYVVLPFEPASVWGERARYYVSGTINDRKFRSRLDQSGKGYLVPLGPAWLKGSGLRPGDSVDVLVADENPRDGVPADVAAALDADPDARTFFEALAGFYRRNYLRWIDATKRNPETRKERIAELVRLMRAGRKQR